ncbi:hypothetical protein HY486_02085 [Candidatus Woesearchaeota archaeon]|nr:hypothetical protein [Candidatus Woesearchaeota archaeon]
MFQDVCIIGATGNVGRTLVRQIVEKSDIGSRLDHVPTRIIGLGSSTHGLFHKKGINPEQALEFSQRCYTCSFCAPSPSMYLLNEAKEHCSNLVFIDTTALNRDMRKFHIEVISHSPFSVATANKHPVASSAYLTFRELTARYGRYAYSCSVMAGAEAVSILQDMCDLRDSVTQIFGCFSGTNGLICSELHKRRAFSEILQEAYALRYTEPDPRDDLSGMDVVRKLVVLVRTAGYNIRIRDVRVQPFIPQESLGTGNVQAFLDQAHKLNDYFSRRVDEAESRGNVLRYVARFGKPVEDSFSLSVGLEEVPASSALGQLHGTRNRIVIVSKAYPEDSPYEVSAPGAGLDITAQNIRRDLLYTHNGRGSS